MCLVEENDKCSVVHIKRNFYTLKVLLYLCISVFKNYATTTSLSEIQ